MQIFIDSADIKEIEKWVDMGIADGVTTNPSIMFRDGVYDTEKGAKEIADLIHPRPISVEVSTNDFEEMIVQAREFASWAPNIVVKIPQVNQFGKPCYSVIRQLEREGIKINATVALFLGQVMLAAKAEATYISIFAGRIEGEGGNSAKVIKESVEWLEHWKFKSRIIVGSIRTVGDFLQAAMSWAHIVTTPPQFLGKMADHKYTRATVEQFLIDAQKALEMMEKARGS